MKKTLCRICSKRPAVRELCRHPECRKRSQREKCQKYRERQGPKPHLEGDNWIRCRECGQLCGKLPGHLRIHAMTTSQYLAKHGFDAPLVALNREADPKKIARARKASGHNEKNPGRRFDRKFYGVVVGSLLGDATITRNFTLKKEGKSRLAIECFAMDVKPYIDGMQMVSTRRGYFVAGSRVAHRLKPIRELFYPASSGFKKVVPRNLVRRHLTWRAIAYWIADDGTRYSDSVKLCTHGLPEDDVRWLADLLREKFGIACTVLRDENRDYTWLRVPSSSMGTLMSGLARYRVPGMEPKFASAVNGHAPYGEGHHWAKLDDLSLFDVCADIDAGEDFHVIAERHGVTADYIDLIERGERRQRQTKRPTRARPEPLPRHCRHCGELVLESFDLEAYCSDACKKAFLNEEARRSQEARRKEKRMRDFQDGHSAIGCEACKTEFGDSPPFKAITHGHLKARHGMTVMEFRAHYPDAPMVNAEEHARRSKLALGNCERLAKPSKRRGR